MPSARNGKCCDLVTPAAPRDALVADTGAAGAAPAPVDRSPLISRSASSQATRISAPKTVSLVTGLGDSVDKAIEKCPKFAQDVQALKDRGWILDYGKKGGGSYCDKNAKKIVVDQSEKGNTAAVVETLAHEVGHAKYTPDPYVPPKGLTRAQFAQKNANRSLKDEGEATLNNVEMKRCLKKNGGVAIGVAGAQSAQYEKIYDKYPNPKDRDKARQEIGDAFADGEHPSTAPNQTYRQYYEKPFNDYYDKLPANQKTN